MATVTAGNVQVVEERGKDDARTGDTATTQTALKRATVYFDNNGTQVAGGTDTLSIDLGAAIQNSARNGKIVTIQNFAMSQAFASRVPSTGVETILAGYATISGNVLSVTPKTTGWVTGSTNGTMSATDQSVRPFGVYVTFTEA